MLLIIFHYHIFYESLKDQWNQTRSYGHHYASYLLSSNTINIPYLFTINIITLRMATSQLQTKSLSYQPSTNSPKNKHSKSPQSSLQSPRLQIPLIAKRMNFVERYIKDFDREQQNKKDKSKNNFLTDRIQANRSVSPEDGGSLFAKDFRSIDAEPALILTEPNTANQKSCIKYSTIRDQKSEQKMESLGRMEVQYLRLKEKAHLPRHFLPSITVSHKRSEPAATISHEQVERQIKRSIITHGGQRYFADLYLMKKGRDKIITSLQTVGKHNLNTTHGHTHQSYDELIKNSMAYEQQVAASKQDFVRKKILQDRNVKKGKMLRGRNMNWNVYYELMALSPRERNKVKGIQKFEADYGIL